MHQHKRSARTIRAGGDIQISVNRSTEGEAAHLRRIIGTLGRRAPCVPRDQKEYTQKTDKGHQGMDRSNNQHVTNGARSRHDLVLTVRAELPATTRMHVEFFRFENSVSTGTAWMRGIIYYILDAVSGTDWIGASMARSWVDTVGLRLFPCRGLRWIDI